MKKQHLLPGNTLRSQQFGLLRQILVGKHGASASGFTLIELLLYMGIFSILLLVLMQIFTSILSVKAESQATSSIAEDQQYILSRLSYDIHRASAITTPALGGTGATLHLTGTGLDETYAIQDGVLVMTDNTTGTTEAVSGYDTTAAVQFMSIGNTAVNSKASVQITLTLTSKVLRDAMQQETKTVTTTVQTR